jgi:hypothetical protein
VRLVTLSIPLRNARADDIDLLNELHDRRDDVACMVAMIRSGSPRNASLE